MFLPQDVAKCAYTVSNNNSILINGKADCALIPLHEAGVDFYHCWQENPLLDHSHCAQTGARFLRTSVTATSWNGNVEAHYSASERCGWSNYGWSSFSILFPFDQAVSTQRGSWTVYTVSITSTWSACGYWQFAFNTAAHSSLSALCSVPPWTSFSAIDVFVYVRLFSLHPFLLTYQQFFKQPIFFVLGGCLQLLILPRLHPTVDRISPWYDLLALFAVNTLIDSEKCVARMYDCQG